MTDDDLDAAMRCYLGGNPDEPGIEPAGMIERLTARFGPPAARIQYQLDEVLPLVMKFPIGDSTRSLGELPDAVAVWLASETPQFAEITRAKMANYFTYQWR